MKKLIAMTMLLILALGLVGFAPAAPAQSSCSSLVLGGNCTLSDGQKLDGDLLVLGGSVALAHGSTVTGDLVLLGGNLQADGRIDGSVTVVGGNARIADQASVGGDVSVSGGSLDLADGAQVGGDVNRNVPAPFSVPGELDLPNWQSSPNSPLSGPVSAGLNLVLRGVWWVFLSLAMGVLALVVTLLAPRHVERTAHAIIQRPAEAGGLGCVTLLIVPLVLVLLAITICGLPISLLGMALLAAGWALGVIALGIELGRRIIEMFKVDWAPGVAAALGTFVLVLLTSVIGAVPCIGWIAPAVVGSVGLGAALITRLGTQEPEGPVLFVPGTAGRAVAPAEPGGAEVFAPPPPGAAVFPDEPLPGPRPQPPADPHQPL